MWRSILLWVVLAPATACTTLSNTARAYLTAPNGLQVDDDRVRRLLHRGLADSALRVVSDRRSPLSPDDRLLRLLYQGTAARYAGRYRDAGAFFDQAFAVSEDRFTKSVSRTATSLLTNDYALPYTAGQAERLMLHYNALLAWSGAGDTDAAAVEARRLVALLARVGEPAADERNVHATLQTVAAAAFEAAGDWNDAAVARRNAVRLGAPIDTLQAGPDSLSGDVVIVIEGGDVAHKVAVGLTVPIFSGDNASASGAGFAAERLLADVGALRNGGVWWDDTPSWRFTNTRYAPWTQARASYLLDMSWPVLRRASLPGSGLVAVRSSASGALAEATVVASVSDAIAADYRRDRKAVMSRTVTRAVAKYLASRAVESAVEAVAKKDSDGDSKDGKKKKDDDNEAARRAAGMLARMFTNAATTAIERADTRAWTLLPGSVSVVRMRLPAGTQDVLVDAGGARQITLPGVDVRPNRTTVVSARVWRDVVQGFRPVVERGTADQAAPQR